MTVSDEFLNSVCTNELQKKIIEVLNDKSLTDLDKMELLVRYIRESGEYDQL